MLRQNWLLQSTLLILTALLLMNLPWFPVSVIGGVLLLILLPGMQIVRWLGLWTGWRHLYSVILSLAFGVSIVPLLIFWTGWLEGLSKISISLTLVLATTIGALFNHYFPLSSQKLPRGVKKIPPIVIGTSAIIVLSIILAYLEPRTDAGSYPVEMGDWIKHHGVAWSLRETGIPPKNIFFAGPEPDSPLTYYYFTHLNVAALDWLSNNPININTAFIIIAILSAFSFIFSVHLLSQELFGPKAANLTVLFVTLIGGGDIIPTFHRLWQKYPDATWFNLILTSTEHIDNWTPTQNLRISVFITHFLWVPQHITALLIVILGLYIYRLEISSKRLIPILALLVAALPGHSIWLSLTVFPALLLYALYHLWITRYTAGWRPAIRLLNGYTLIAGGALLIILPFMLTLLKTAPGQAGITFNLPDHLNSWPLLSPFQGWFPNNVLAKLLDVLIHYFIEMGALLVAGLSGWWQFFRTHTSAKSKPSLFPILTLFLVIGFGLITFFASGRAYADMGLILNNDLSLRAIMPAQLTLALFAGNYTAQLQYKKNWLPTVIIGSLMLIGLASALWEIKAMGLAKYTQPPRIPADILAAFEAMPNVTTLNSVVQHRRHNDFAAMQLDYGHRPNGYSTGEAITVGGIPPKTLGTAIEVAKQAFANRLPLRSYQLLHNLGADYVFVGPEEHASQYTPEKFNASFYFTPVYTAPTVAIYQLNPVFTEKTLSTFDNNALEWRGYFIDPAPIYPDQTNPSSSLGLVTAWRLTRPADKNYTVFIHFVDSDGNIIAQADHQLWAWDIRSEGPTTTWTPNLTHLDIVALPPRVLTSNGPLSIRMGIWLPENGQQFSPENQILDTDEAGRLVISNWR